MLLVNSFKICWTIIDFIDAYSMTLRFDFPSAKPFFCFFSENDFSTPFQLVQLFA